MTGTPSVVVAAFVLLLFVCDRIRKGKVGAVLGLVLVVAWLALVTHKRS